jgi:hypothetical protein
MEFQILIKPHARQSCVFRGRIREDELVWTPERRGRWNFGGLCRLWLGVALLHVWTVAGMQEEK